MKGSDNRFNGLLTFKFLRQGNRFVILHFKSIASARNKLRTSNSSLTDDAGRTVLLSEIDTRVFLQKFNKGYNVVRV